MRNTSNFRGLCFHLSVALTLSACVLGTKVGDLPDETTSAGDSTDATGTEGASSGGKDSSSSGQTGITEGETSTAGPGETSTAGPGETTGGPSDECEGLDEATCKANPVCDVMLGSAYDFEGCPVGPQYLGCMVANKGCDEAEKTVCRDGTDEVYLRNNGCVPLGFSECETPLALCGSCEALTEAECLAEAEECQGLYGAPYVEQQGAECVDFGQQVFLACAANGGACPPFVPTVCPEGELAPRFDVPSGCIPFGFETCEGGAPVCL